jgi:hypothetical protein
MLFDQPRELPIATVRRAGGSTFARWMGAFRHWIGARWSWLRPRTVPVVVALVGMFAVLNAVNYLARPPAAAITMDDGPNTEAPAPAYGFHVRLVLQP